MESHIEWKIGKGEVSFWYDKWCSRGPIYKHMPVDFTPPGVNLREVLNRRTWNWDILTSKPTNEIRDKLYSIGITLDENKKTGSSGNYPTQGNSPLRLLGIT